MSEVHLRSAAGDVFRIDVDRTIGDSKRLGRLEELLAEHHRQAGRKQPEALARQYMERLLVAVYSDAQKAFEGRKGAAVDYLIALQSEATGIYHDVLRGKPPELARLKSIIRAMQDHFDELRQSLEESMRGAPRPETEKAAAGFGDVPIAAPSHLRRLVEPAERLRSLAGDENWKLNQAGDRAVRTMPDRTKVTLEVKGGELEMLIEEPGGGKRKYREFQMLEVPYGERPNVGEVMQAHHGCQAALLEDLLPGIYDRDKVVTIYLRDSTLGSPHGMVTNQLQPRALEQFRSGKRRVTYGEIRDIAVEQLKFINAPYSDVVAYLKAHDGQITKMIAHLPESERRRILGNMTKYY
jgi:hypothetical protein